MIGLSGDSMKLSIFTTITDPERRGDNWRDALRCYMEFADEVIVVDGSKRSIEHKIVNDPELECELKFIYSKWPREFSWDLIGKQFQKGYEAATGDWVIHADLDFLFHENDFERVRQIMKNNEYTVALNFIKWQFIVPHQYNVKSRLVVAVNKKVYGDRIKFNSGGDLCQPSLDGQEIKPSDVPETRVPIYNYDKMTKTRDQVVDDCKRMARAWKTYFGDEKLGNDQNAYLEWLKMMLGRNNSKPQQLMALHRHPMFVQETIKNLKPEQWGFSAFNCLGDNLYV